MNDIVFYTGIIGLAGTVIWDMKIKKVAPCPTCREVIEKKV